MAIAQLMLALAMLLFAMASGQRADMPISVKGTRATEAPPNALSVTKAASTAQPEETKVKQVDKVLTNIHAVDIRVMESYPMRISLEVRGEHPDGCDFPVHVRQSRADSDIKVEVYREVPADVFCPMILRPYEGTIHLDGDFDFGAYTISVNDHSQNIEL